MDQIRSTIAGSGALNIDGSMGEGGGQLLRSALSLSICTQRPFRMHHIRAHRKPPGLRRQHMVAIQAAASICRASVEGLVLGSQHLVFEPARVVPGEYQFDIGTAGSTGLVLQTLLPPLLLAPEASHVTLRGGTHNPRAPCYDFLDASFVPLLQEMGARVQLQLIRSGYYPKGGGEIQAEISPVRKWWPLVLIKRGPLLNQRAVATVAHLPRHIAERELQVLARQLDMPAAHLHIHEDRQAYGPGNVLNVCLHYAKHTAVFTEFGERGVPAEQVAGQLVKQVKAYLDSEVPVEPYLADQLLIYMALANGGKFLTLEPTAHLLSNASIVEMFTTRHVQVKPVQHDEYYISIV